MVYITQNRIDKDLSAAMAYGSIKFLVPQTLDVLRGVTEDTTAAIKIALKDFSVDDYLLLIGSPVIIGLATHLAGEALLAKGFGLLTLLQWDRRGENYLPITISL